MNPTEFIRLILDNTAGSDDGKTGKRIYRDEPVLRSTAPVEVPEKIKAMRRIARDLKKRKSISDAEIFYEQARFMEDYTDDYPRVGRDCQYTPTYETVSDENLRGYFSWRVRIRNGEYGECGAPYVLLYANELIMGIGIPPGEKGLSALFRLWDRYRADSSWIDRRLSAWMYDYAAYYGIPPENLPDRMRNSEAENAYITICDAKSAETGVLYDAITVLSSYNPKKSKFGKLNPYALSEVCCRVYNAYSDYYGKRHKNNTYAGALFGQIVRWRHKMFYDGCFFEKRPHGDCKYEINGLHSYVCENGGWILRQFYGTLEKSAELGALMKATDCVLRRRLGFAELKMPAKLLKSQLAIIEKEVGAFAAEEEEKRKSEVKIDFSRLDAIRRDAEITAERLTTDDRIVATGESAPGTQIESYERSSRSASAGKITEEEKSFLFALMNGENYSGKTGGTPVSMLADSINERLFDRFGDTVVIFVDDRPEIVDEYTDELRRIICV